MNGELQLTPDLLAKPAQQVVRLIGQALLADVTVEYERVWSGDQNDLHDLRVALRRLRSWLRAFQDELSDTVRRKSRRRLRKMTRSTNAARDAEVALEWIATQTDLKSRERAGARHLHDQWQLEVEASQTTAKEYIGGRLPKLLATLSGDLDEYWERHPTDSSKKERRSTMNAALRTALQRHASRFAKAVARIDGLADVEAVHRARIAVKRLRYLLESVGADPEAAALTARLRTLQDALGAVHDSHRIADRIIEALSDSAARDARRVALQSMNLKDGAGATTPALKKIRPGFMALAQRVNDRQQLEFASFRRRWRKSQVQKAVATVKGLRSPSS